MPVSLGVDQLCPDPDPIACLLDAAFHDMRYAEFISDFAQISFYSGLVLHDRRAADDFQVRNL